MPWRCVGEWRDSSTRWRWMVTFTPQPLSPRGNSRLYPLDRRLGGIPVRSGPVRSAEKRNLLTLTEMEPRFFDRPVCSHLLYRLSYPSSQIYYSSYLSTLHVYICILYIRGIEWDGGDGREGFMRKPPWSLWRHCVDVCVEGLGKTTKKSQATQ
jgi:hypothetical protein